MYEKIKSYIASHTWVWYLIVAGIACTICWIIYGGGNNSDYNRTIDHLERVQEQQRESIELNQTVTDSVERSASLNREAGERITRIEVYQQQASERIEEGTSQLNEAAAILERNEQLIERVKQGHQAQQGDGRATTSPTQHLGAD